MEPQLPCRAGSWDVSGLWPEPLESAGTGTHWRSRQAPPRGHTRGTHCSLSPGEPESPLAGSSHAVRQGEQAALRPLQRASLRDLPRSGHSRGPQRQGWAPLTTRSYASRRPLKTQLWRLQDTAPEPAAVQPGSRVGHGPCGRPAGSRLPLRLAPGSPEPAGLAAPSQVLSSSKAPSRPLPASAAPRRHRLAGPSFPAPSGTFQALGARDFPTHPRA